jgi:ubiquinone/menaquinone biosynthesis C-methylase UbiE
MVSFHFTQSYTPKRYIDKIFIEFNRVLKRGGKVMLSVKEEKKEAVEENI